MGDLTTSARVKRYQGITSASMDTLIAELIVSVSAKVELYLNRTIASTLTAGTYSGNGWDHRILLRHWPVLSVPAATVTLDDTALDAADFNIVLGMGELVYTPSGDPPSPWPAGLWNVVCTYQYGYAATPPALEGAVTEQVVWELKRTAPLGGRLCERSTIVEGATAQYSTGPWAPGVLDVLKSYRRREWRSPRHRN